jgi:hypothetical protein
MSPQEQAMEDANRYRVEASRHYQLHKECFRKAQDASKKRLTAVASYYSQVVSGGEHTVNTPKVYTVFQYIFHTC